MKKLTALIVLILALNACRQDETPQPNEGLSLLSSEASVTRGILTFSSADFYTTLIESGDDERKSTLVAELNQIDSYNSLKDRLNKMEKSVSNGRALTSLEVEVIEDNDFLATILNEDGMIAIGEHYFKINFTDEIVYVLPVSFQDQLEDLRNENLSNGNIMVFSTSDDVLELLDEGYTESPSSNGRTMLLCGDRKASGKEKIKYFEYSDNTAGVNYRVKAKHVYQKAGVYFSLLTELKHMSRYQNVSSLTPWSPSNTEIYLEYYYKYKRRCRSGDSEGRSTRYTSWDNKLNRRHYESTRGLAKIWLESKYEFLARNADTGGSTVQLLIPVVKDGY